MIDVIFIVIDVICIIAFVYFIHCEKENTKARKEQTKQLEIENKLLNEIISRWNRLLASYEQVKDGGINE